MTDDEYYPLTIDHSQDIEIRTNKQGKMFAIKNIRQEFNGNEMTLIAEIGGDQEAGQEYLKSLGKRLVEGIAK